MIKKTIFEDELISGMQYQLSKQANNRDIDHLENAVDYLNSAASILDDVGMIKIANKVVMIIDNIGKHPHQCYPDGGPDKHTKGLTPEKMVKNLKEHGTVFNMDKNDNDEDILEVSDSDEIDLEDDSEDDFEDEKD